MGMLVLGIGSLQFVLDKGQQEDWFASTAITVLAVMSVVGAGRAHHLRAARRPSDRRSARLQGPHATATGVFLMTVLGFVLYGSLVLLPIMLQTLLGYSSVAGRRRRWRRAGSGR